MTLKQFQRAFLKVRNLGWVQSKRKGPTGIGQTLEQLLGLTENNIALPDLKGIELKAHRIGSQSMITLFTFNRKVWKVKPLDAVKKYGTPDKDGRLGMYFTMSRTPNSIGLFLNIEDESIDVRQISGEVIAEWQIQTLADRFMQKLPALILVSAFSEMRGDYEWFKFDHARVLRDTNSDLIKSQILSDQVCFDFRYEQKKNVDETRFIVNENNISLLYKNSNVL